MGIQRFDRVLLNLIYAPILPIGLFLAVWWGSISFVDDKRIFIWALAGLILGLMLDLFLYRRWHIINYRRTAWMMIIIYLFYSIGMFGFFMGVPVFNVILGTFAGAYTARRSILNRLNFAQARLAIQRTGVATTIIFGSVCIASAYLGLRDPYTAANIGGMLGLEHDPGRLALWLIVIVGGLLLLAIQYLIVRSVALWTLQRAKTSAE